MKLLYTVIIPSILLTIFFEISKCEHRQTNREVRRDKRNDKYQHHQTDDNLQYIKRRRKYEEADIALEPALELEPQRIQFISKISPDDENAENSANESSEEEREEEAIERNKIITNALRGYSKKLAGHKRKKIVIELKNPQSSPLSIENDNDDDDSNEYEPEIEVVRSRYRRERPRRKRYRTYRHTNRYDSDSLESIEMPTRYKRKYDYNAEERPLYNLILGILETVKETTQNELRRAEQIERQQRSQMLIDELKNGILNMTSFLIPNNNNNNYI